jgi:hypothetical protein
MFLTERESRFSLELALPLIHSIYRESCRVNVKKRKVKQFKEVVDIMVLNQRGSIKCQQKQGNQLA